MLKQSHYQISLKNSAGICSGMSLLDWERKKKKKIQHSAPMLVLHFLQLCFSRNGKHRVQGMAIEEICFIDNQQTLPSITLLMFPFYTAERHNKIFVSQRNSVSSKHSRHWLNQRTTREVSRSYYIMYTSMWCLQSTLLSSKLLNPWQ